MPYPAAGYLPKPLKGPPRQSFAPLARTAAGRACACSIQLGTPKGSTGFAVTRRRVSAETPEGAPSAELRSVLPFPFGSLGKVSRQSRSRARTAAGRACACSIQLGTPKGSTGFAVTRRRVSAETPEGAPSAELRFTRTNSRRQSLRLFNSAWHTKGEHRQSLCSPLVCPPGIEPGTYSVGGCHSIQLRYGHICRPFGLLLL